jgi:uncharacterized protein
VKLLPRQPGTKEARYAHLLSGDVQERVTPPELADAVSLTQTADASSASNRLARLEEEVATLRAEVFDLKTQLAAFQKQFL